MALGPPQVIPTLEESDSILSFRAGANWGFQDSGRHSQEAKNQMKARNPHRSGGKITIQKTTCLLILRLFH